MKVVIGWAKELEEKVETMDVEYKARIVELEAKEPVTAPEQCEARIEELKDASAMIILLLEDAQNLLEDVTTSWTAMEEIPDLVIIYEEV